MDSRDFTLEISAGHPPCREVCLDFTASLFSFSPDKPEAVCVPTGGSVLVPCPNLTYDEIKYKLLQGGKVIFNYTFARKTANPIKVRADLEVLEDTKNHTFNFRLIRVNSSRHGIYKCEGEIIYPPPKGILHNNQRILLLVEGKYFLPAPKTHHCLKSNQSTDYFWVVSCRAPV